MKLNRSPLVWAILALLVTMGFTRFTKDARDGKGDLIVWAVVTALVIVGVLWWWQSSSRKRAAQALASAHPGDLSAAARSTTNTTLTQQVARELGTKAKGTLNINAVSANARELTLWYGANKPTLTVPASRITSLHTGEVSEGIHRYPNLVVAIDERLPLAFSPRLEDGDTLDGFARRLATALGLPAEQIDPPLPVETA